MSYYTDAYVEQQLAAIQRVREAIENQLELDSGYMPLDILIKALDGEQ